MAKTSDLTFNKFEHVEGWQYAMGKIYPSPRA